MNDEAVEESQDQLFDEVREDVEQFDEGVNGTSTDLQQFKIRMGHILSVADEIQESKNPAYSGKYGQDVHANFKEIANMLDVDPMEVWAVYFMKHVMALANYAKDPDIEQAEGIEGRFADALNYIRIGYSLDIETRQDNDKPES